MSVNFKTYKSIILVYPMYAGGKFISNCLSLSNNSVPQSEEATRYLLDSPDDYEYRLSYVNKSLPNKKNMHRWNKGYEFGEYLIYGNDAYYSWINDNPNPNYLYNEITEKLSNSTFNFFIVAHNDEQALNVLKAWPNSTVIRIVNYNELQDISIKIKTTDQVDYNYLIDCCNEKTYNILRGNSWPKFKEFEEAGYCVDNIHPQKYKEEILTEIKQYYKLYNVFNLYTFDMSCIFNEREFMNNMKKLYNELKYKDFNQNIMYKFWKAYVNLHK